MTAIIDADGYPVVTYHYDPWGEILSIGDSMASTLGVHNPLLYRGYVYDHETGLYYLQSRYYNPDLRRFINADAFASTGQGFIGYNMFAYCLNNPVNFVDSGGENAEALSWWAGGMWWLCAVDAYLPVGDIVYGVGVAVLSVVVIFAAQDSVEEPIYDAVSGDIGPASPNNNDDDDDDDDYYNNDDNFGGRQAIGKSKGNTPRNNKVQNKQFNDATRGISPQKQRIIHDLITNKGLGYHDIAEIAKGFR